MTLAYDYLKSGSFDEVVTPSHLLTFRERMGWSQEGLAQFLGVTTQVVTAYENGRFPIPVGRATMLRLAWAVLEDETNGRAKA